MQIVKRVILFFVAVLAGIWVFNHWAKVEMLFSVRPDVGDLAFNAPKSPGPVVVSPDERINTDVFEKTHQAVVNIAATTLTMNFWMQVIPQQGQGSGFIIDGKGYILTNNHVVAKAQKITVTLGNGKKAEATLVGRDASTDLAVIKISQDLVVRVAALGDSDQLKVGQKAIAIGNPFGLSHTLTTGIVSALKREIRDESGVTLSDLIQTDAAINPGNSGGPLLNSNGEVIGINTAIFSMSGGYQGIGFAIPINRAKEVATQLITAGRYPRPWLGISGLSLSEDLAKTLDLQTKEGVMVVEVALGSPAKKAGLRGGKENTVIGNVRLPVGGDTILSIDDKKVTDMNSLISEVNRHHVGETLQVEILRDNRRQTLKILLQEKPQ
jgi:putative serine protease PepD